MLLHSFQSYGTKPLWQCYQQSHLVAKQEELVKEIMHLVLIFVHASKGPLTWP
jgi:hypothetical protein